MGEMKHTPGPWIVRPDYADDGHVDELRGFDIVSSTGVEVVSCEGIIPGPLSREDAHLIAAAPDLLKELGDLVELLDGMRHNISWEVSMDDLLAGPRAALSKASPSEGGEGSSLSSASGQEGEDHG